MLNTDEAEDVFCDGDKCAIPVPHEQPETEEITFDDSEKAETSPSHEAPATQ